jgi:hypothetical protein
MSIKLIGRFKHQKSSLLQFNPALDSHPYVSRMQRSMCSYKACREKENEKGKRSNKQVRSTLIDQSALHMLRIITKKALKQHALRKENIKAST